MTLSLESVTVAFTGSVDDILSSTLLPLQLKYPERRIIFKIVDGKTRVRMPREELERVIDELVMNSKLFPRESPLIVQGSSDGERYLLSFICTDSGLNTEQAKALTNYRYTAIETKCNQQVALCRLRRIVEFYGGQFQLNSENDLGLSVNIALPQEEKTGSGRVTTMKLRGASACGARSFQAEPGHDVETGLTMSRGGSAPLVTNLLLTYRTFFRWSLYAHISY